jgi:DNA polymerase alpha subunit B
MVNPSFLSKGTYGTISIAARSAGTPKERVTAEVMKIELRAATTSTSTTLP